MITRDRHIDFTDLDSGKETLPNEMGLGGENVNGENADRRDRDNPSEPAAGKRINLVSPKFRVKELLDGTVLVRENMIRQLPYVIFLTVLGVIYIGNRFHAEHMVRQISELKTEVGNLRAEQITTTSELMNISRPSEVAALVKSRNLDLKESLEPPKKLRRR
jgi:hypothetical protein